VLYCIAQPRQHEANGVVKRNKAMRRGLSSVQSVTKHAGAAVGGRTLLTCISYDWGMDMVYVAQVTEIL
jgi:hypothetical protein